CQSSSSCGPESTCGFMKSELRRRMMNGGCLCERFELPGNELRVLFNFIKNGQCRFERAQPFFSRNRSFLPCCYRLQKCLDFELQWLIFGNRERLEADLRVPGHAEHRPVLPLIVERYVLVWLEQPQLPYALGRDPACRQVCHAARVERQPHIGDVHL